MDAQRWRQIEVIYHSALNRPIEGREAFLADACRGDGDLLQRVQSLLAAEEQAGSFLEKPALEDASTLAAAPRQVASYQILHRLGAGGMGEVYLAHDSKLGRDVAIKTLPREFANDPERVSRLRREARTLASLNHPNIAAIYDLVEGGGVTCLVLELVEGETLRGPLPLDKALDYARQIADGLEAAHNKGIVHRDLKPGNAKVTPEGRVKVLDFGLAKAIWGSDDRQRFSQVSTVAGTTTLAGQVLGTPPYMSPEQARGEAIDKRTDVWAFGCLLYELLTGKRAFEGTEFRETVAAVLEREPDWSALPAKTPARIRELLRRCLQKEPSRRPQEINSVRQVIEECTASFHGMKRGQIIAAALAATLLFASVGWIAWRTIAPPTGRIQSIAVLPFENDTHNPNLDYITDGLTDTIINALSQVATLRVIPRSSTMHFKNEGDPLKAARELNVRAVLTGHITSAGGDLLAIQAELTDANQHAQLWGKRFQANFGDVLSVEEQIASEVPVRLLGHVPADARQKQARVSTTNPDAFDLFLKAEHETDRRTPDSLRAAITLYRQAIGKDPRYASAYLGLYFAQTLATEYAGVPWEDVRPRAVEALRKALQLDPSNSKTHLFVGDLHLLDWEWDEAAREIDRAIALDPANADAYKQRGVLLNYRLRHQEAIQSFRTALGFDPFSLIVHTNLAFTYHALGDTVEAERVSAHLVQLDPEFSLGHQLLGEAYAREGKPVQAIDELQKAVELSQRSPTSLARLGFTYGFLNERSKALEVAHELEEKHRLKSAPGMLIAVVYAGLGDNDAVFRWLNPDDPNEKVALEQAPAWWEFQKVHSDARWKAFLRKLQLIA